MSFEITITGKSWDEVIAQAAAFGPAPEPNVADTMSTQEMLRLLNEKLAPDGLVAIVREQETTPDVRDTRISDLDFSAKTQRLLIALPGFTTVGDMLAAGRATVAGARGVGVKVMKEIDEKLEALGVAWPEEPEEPEEPEKPEEPEAEGDERDPDAVVADATAKLRELFTNGDAEQKALAKAVGAAALVPLGVAHPSALKTDKDKLAYADAVTRGLAA